MKPAIPPANGPGSRSMRSRRGISLIEVVTVVAVLAILLGILVPAVQQSREDARRTACGDHLRVIGSGLAAYHDTWKELPPILCDRELTIRHSPFALITDHITQQPGRTGVACRYDSNRPWRDQSTETARCLIPEFLCPSNTHPEVVSSEAFARLEFPVGTEFATADYILSKGPNDSWCLPDGPFKYGPILDTARGVFGLNQQTSLADIKDGTSQTIMIGEGATGPGWRLVSSKPFDPNKPFTHPDVVEPYGYWISPRINTTNEREKLHIVTSGIYGTTSLRMNERNVTETFADSAGLDDCRPSEKGGPHKIAGFRSDHDVGSMFLFADGSTHFLHQDIDPGLFDAFGSIRGTESIYFGN